MFFRPRSSSVSNSSPSLIPAHVLHTKLSNDSDSKSVDHSHCFRTRQINTPTIVIPDTWHDCSSGETCDGHRESHRESPRADRDAHSNNGMNVVQRRRKAVHRSGSDLTKRFSNSSEFSDLSSRYSRNSADLEKFFNDMGLDQSTLEPMTLRQCSHNNVSNMRLSSSELYLFQSMSSLNSPDTRGWSSNDSYQQRDLIELSGITGNVTKSEDVTRTEHVDPSGTTGDHNTFMGERNDRVIRWLCNVKRAISQDGETDRDREALGSIASPDSMSGDLIPGKHFKHRE